MEYDHNNALLPSITQSVFQKNLSWPNDLHLGCCNYFFFPTATKALLVDSKDNFFYPDKRALLSIARHLIWISSIMCLMVGSRVPFRWIFDALIVLFWFGFCFYKEGEIIWRHCVHVVGVNLSTHHLYLVCNVSAWRTVFLLVDNYSDFEANPFPFLFIFLLSFTQCLLILRIFFFIILSLLCMSQVFGYPLLGCNSLWLW